MSLIKKVYNYENTTHLKFSKDVLVTFRFNGYEISVNCDEIVITSWFYKQTIAVHVKRNSEQLVCWVIYEEIEVEYDDQAKVYEGKA